MKYFVAIAAFAAAVSAQGLDISKLPPCAVKCATGLITKTKCSITDPKVAECLCADTKFQDDFKACAEGPDACTKEQQCDFYTFSKDTCSATKTPLDESKKPAHCGGSDAPAESSAPAESAPAESSAPAETSAPAESTGAEESTGAPAPTGEASATETVAPTETGNNTAPPVATETFNNAAGTLTINAAAVVAVAAAFFAL